MADYDPTDDLVCVLASSEFERGYQAAVDLVGTELWATVQAEDGEITLQSMLDLRDRVQAQRVPAAGRYLAERGL